MNKALEPLILAWRVPDLRNRLLFILGAIVLYAIALHIPIPGANPEAIQALFNSSAGVLGFIDMFGGGALSKLSITALGIMPYITSSIIFQILTIAFPKMKEMQQDEYGRRQIKQWTRWAAIALTLVQAAVAARAFQSVTPAVLPQGTTSEFIQAMVSMTAGTMFLIWLGEQMTIKGIGNGISFIIFAGIVARLPITVANLLQEAQVDPSIYLKLFVMLAVFVATIYIVITVTQGERRIPIKYAPRQAGQRMVQGGKSYLPLKLAAAGVIPIIFAVSIVLFPGQIATWYLGSNQGSNTTMVSIMEGVQGAFSPTSPIASLLYAGLVLLFTYFYTAVLFDVRDLSDNLKRAGGQVQGYAPGRPTEIYINRVLTRITFAGGVFLALLALMQWWMPSLLGLQNNEAGGSLLVGGTSLLIVVGVALEIMQNLDQQLKMRQYEGLAKGQGKGKL